MTPYLLDSIFLFVLAIGAQVSSQLKDFTLFRSGEIFRVCHFLEIGKKVKIWFEAIYGNRRRQDSGYFTEIKNYRKKGLTSEIRPMLILFGCYVLQNSSMMSQWLIIRPFWLLFLELLWPLSQPVWYFSRPGREVSWTLRSNPWPTSPHPQTSFLT